MPHVAITLEVNNASKDLALPLDVTVRLLVDSLVDALRLKRSRGQRYRLSIKTDQGLRPIPLNATLSDANILHGMVLTLLLEDQKTDERISKTDAYLQADSGRILPLTGQATVIGRSDSKSGIFVDIDLKGLVADPKNISRRHARIEQDGQRFYLVDLASINGTKLNGKRIPPNEKQPLQSGDLIEFGRGGVTLHFVAKQ
jgi:uncharacterized ubiquitin-like protein YukD